MYAKRLVFVAWFNAGVRAIDIRSLQSQEVGYYIPAKTGKTDKRCVKMPDGAERCKVAIQTNNLEVDDRGYIYIVDRANTGMHTAGHRCRPRDREILKRPWPGKAFSRA